MGTPQRREHVFAFVGLGTVDAVATIFLGACLNQGDFLIPILVGFFCGQAGAIIVWSVCAPMTSYWRAPLGVLFTSIFAAVVGSPIFVTLYQSTGIRDVSFFLPIPLFTLVILFLVWWAKNAFGWRLKNAVAGRRFSIIDLIVAVSMVGFCLALVRIGVQNTPALEGPSPVILFIACVAWTMILVLPITRAAFFMKGEKRERFLIGFSSVLLVGLFIVPMSLGGNPALALPAAMILCFCHGVLLLTMYLCLRYLRISEIIVPADEVTEKEPES